MLFMEFMQLLESTELASEAEEERNGNVISPHENDSFNVLEYHFVALKMH